MAPAVVITVQRHCQHRVHNASVPWILQDELNYCRRACARVVQTGVHVHKQLQHLRMCSLMQQLNTGTTGMTGHATKMRTSLVPARTGSSCPRLAAPTSSVPLNLLHEKNAERSAVSWCASLLGARVRPSVIHNVDMRSKGDGGGCKCILHSFRRGTTYTPATTNVDHDHLTNPQSTPFLVSRGDVTESRPLHARLGFMPGFWLTSYSFAWSLGYAAAPASSRPT